MNNYEENIIFPPVKDAFGTPPSSGYDCGILTKTRFYDSV
jgi:hypothetical protein